MIRLSRRKLSQYGAKALANGDVSVIRQLAAYLVSSSRVDEVPLLAADIEKALATYGVIVADLAATRELSSDEQAALDSLVMQRYSARDVATRFSVDTHLLGGIKLAAAGEELDASMARRIARLKTLNT